LKQKYFLSITDENRMDDINDKMCLIHLEYHWAKAIFNVMINNINFTDFLTAEA